MTQSVSIPERAREIAERARAEKIAWPTLHALKEEFPQMDENLGGEILHRLINDLVAAMHSERELCAKELCEIVTDAESKKIFEYAAKVLLAAQ